MLYLTLVGNHDKLGNQQNGPGAVLTIFLEYKERIEDVYIFVTPSKNTDKINYQQIAEKNKTRMLAEKAGLNVELIPIDLSNPIDFDLVYPKLLREVQQVINRGENRNKEKIINITSGTPTMTTCWVLLHKSGLISNSRLVQSFETRFARERGKSTQEVNFEIDDFPQITVPEELRLQLNIANREKDELTERLAASELDRKIPELIGCSPQIREVKDIILHDIDKESHVLIVGERGTGKQEVAEAIWRLHRTNESMETFNCGAWNADLIISELFGHRKGAFTGATQDKTGIIKKSNGQLLFLDEIGNLPVIGQQAMLRLLQFGEIQPLGAEEVEKVDVQIVAATNKDINDAKVFAQDLKDRFPVRIPVPPLRERREDIPLLANHFLKIFSQGRDLTSPFVLSKDVLTKFYEYDWPGNVRDLMNWVRTVTRRFDGGEITLDKLPQRIIADIISDSDTYELPDLPLPIRLEEYTKKIIEKARKMSGGKSIAVDKLLKQNDGAEKARRHRDRKR